MKSKLNFVVSSGLLGAVATAALILIPPATTVGTAAGVPPQLAQGFSSIVKAVTPAVVNIQVTQGERVRGPRDPRRRDHEGPPGRPGPGPGPFGGPPPGPFGGPGGPGAPGPFGGPPGEPDEPEQGPPFGGPPGRPDMSGGSGVIIDPNGYIVTNNHVIDRASDIKVYLSNKKEYQAKIIGADPKTDLAVIKIEATGLPYLKWGGYDELQVGDIALAVGSPFGLSQTVTMGIISALGRGNVGIADYEDFIQTDASINPGNSGGALVNLKGELIGINTAIFSRTGGNEGIGFAVPVSLAKNITDSLIKTGKVVRGWLGVAIQEITPDLAKAFKAKEQKGALVSDVNEQGPALKAGVKRGDVIVEFDGKEVQTVSDLRNRVAQTQVGSKVPLKVVREGQEKMLTIHIGERPTDAMLARGTEPGAAPPESAEARKAPLNVLADLKVKAIDEETRAQLNIGAKTAGVLVAHVQAGSPAEQAGLQRGDVIQEVNRHPVMGIKDYDAAAAKIKKEENAVLLVNRQGNTLFIVINP
jgi:serine protease Do